jgi:predicted small lipoprotein YifL
MRLMPTLMIAATALAALAGCGTKTPLTLPPQAPQKASLAPAAATASVAPVEARIESRP